MWAPVILSVLLHLLSAWWPWYETFFYLLSSLLSSILKKTQKGMVTYFVLLQQKIYLWKHFQSEIGRIFTFIYWEMLNFTSESAFSVSSVWFDTIFFSSQLHWVNNICICFGLRRKYLLLVNKYCIVHLWCIIFYLFKLIHSLVWGFTGLALESKNKIACRYTNKWNVFICSVSKTPLLDWYTILVLQCSICYFGGGKLGFVRIYKPPDYL